MNNTCWLADRYPELVLQPLWDLMRERQVLLRSPLLAACFAFSIHLIFCAPYLLLDILGGRCQWIYKYRIDGRINESFQLQRWLDCLGRIILKYLCGILPSVAFFQSLRGLRLPDEAPSCFLALKEIALCLLLFDTFFFGWHYFMHRVPWLFQEVHRAHHQNHNTFALAAQDGSIAELVSLQTLAQGTAALVRCHPLSELVFHLLNTYLAVDDHCGYDLPWALHRLVPCFSGARYHQAHHQKYKGNYAPYFRHWDWIFGTALMEDRRARRREAGLHERAEKWPPGVMSYFFSLEEID
ncbi:cholesterol 25-hydroxylase-like protein [Engraulis encrasicolus]|uniref:cholesterol 25-hydroxylase-like protein n=1 Tax=Engraulis encrasicolus TaxID=184585 RepID=UPI002FD4BFD4